MAIQNIRPPGVTPVMVYPLQELARQSAAVVDNRHAVEALLDYTPLPAPKMTPRPDGVFVSVADLDDLGEWLQALGGRIRRGPVFEGVAVWTLHTETAPRADGSSVAVRVSVPVLVDESVMPYIRSAVAA